MIKSVTVINHLGESLHMELRRPEESGFLIRDITGLGPVKSDINTKKLARKHGVRYNSSYLGQRDIVMQLQFIDDPGKPDMSIEHLRHKSYRHFPINRSVKFIVETDMRTVETEAYIEHNEPDIFSNTEGCSITMLCPDPFLYDINKKQIIFSGIDPMFEFRKPSIDEAGYFPNSTDEEPVNEFANIHIDTAGSVRYEGEHETGMIMYIYVMGAAKHITIRNASTRESMRIDTDKLGALTNSTGVMPGDYITIDTHKKTITLLRDGVYINILNCLDKGIKWFTLRKGENVIAYEAEAGSVNLQFRVEYRDVYEGV